MTKRTLTLPAPAKINRFLHITGRRADGYHNLQTVFQFLDYGDDIDFTVSDDSDIELFDEHSGIAVADNLITKAASQLRQAVLKKGIDTPRGCSLRLHKRLPSGAGLGGGSSDAATTLVGLNYLWGQPLSQQELLALGLTLGADVPIFIHGQTAFAEGVGERFTHVEADCPFFLVVKPEVSISTAALFNHPQLQRNCAPLTASQWQQQSVSNVFESVVCDLYPEVAKLRERLLQYAPTRLTGSGACLFAQFTSYQAAARVKQQFCDLQSFVAQGQNRSTLIRTLTQL